MNEQLTQLPPHIEKTRAMLALPKLHEATNEELTLCIRYLARATGLPAENLPDIETLAIIFAFLRESYKDLTIGEFKDAVDLACMNKLKDVELKIYGGVLSNAYIGKILSAYRYSEIRAKAIFDLKKATPAIQIDISEETKQKKIIDSIQQQFDDYKAGNPIFDYGGIGYNYLTSNGYFRPAADRKNELMEICIHQVKLELNEQRQATRDYHDRLKIDKLLSNENLKDEAIRRAKLILLKDYFQGCIDLEQGIFER